MTSSFELEFELIPAPRNATYLSLPNGRLTGTSGSDGIIGDSLRNVLIGRGGDDYLFGGAGNDVIRGGSGIDSVSYESFLSTDKGVTVNLLKKRAIDQYRNTDKLFNVENVDGSSGSDSLTGNNGKNVISGWYGDDTISGLNGDDLLAGGAGRDTLYGGKGSDRFAYAFASEGGDIIKDFSPGSDQILIVGEFFLPDEFREGKISESQFFLGSSPRRRSQIFGYNGAGELIYDADGSGSGSGQVLAKLSGKPNLQASDIFIA